MKKLFTMTAAAALLSLSADTAMANANDNAKIDMQASQPKICQIDENVGGGGTVSGIGGSTSADEEVLVLDDSNFFDQFLDGSLTGTDGFTIKYDAYCNHAYKVSIRSDRNGFRNNSVVQGSAGLLNGFRTCYTYDATATHLGTATQPSATINTNCGSNSPVTASSGEQTFQSGELQVEVDMSGDGTPAAAGTFRDIITVRLGNAL